MINKIVNYIKSFWTNSSVSLLSSSNKFNYLLNDPSTPDLIEEINVPPLPNNLKFSIVGYESNDTNIKQQAQNCGITLSRTVNYFNNVISKMRPPINRWASSAVLNVIPRAGKNLNAFYDRANLKFFFDYYKNQPVFLVDSSDVVAHETGHALLDAIRPDLWNVQYLEVWSMHEAFADSIAILNAMQSDVLLKKMTEEVKENLMKSNVISRLAEQFGGILYGRNYLRDAAIKFIYIPPENLPSKAKDDQLAAECHSFGRIFTSAWYEIMMKIYERELQKTSPEIALKMARDVAAVYLFQSIQTAPRQPRFFEAVAKGMIASDRANGNRYSDILNLTFLSYKIIKNEIKMLSNINWTDLREKLTPEDDIGRHKELILVRQHKNKNIKLQDHFVISQNNKDNPLYKAEIEMPVDSYYEFDKYGNLMDELHVDEEYALNQAALCVQQIRENEDYGKKDSMWSIKEGKLARNFFEFN